MKDHKKISPLTVPVANNFSSLEHKNISPLKS